MNFTPALTITAVLLSSGMAIADTATSPMQATGAKPATAAKTAPEDKVVCKTVTYTGSRLGGTRTCLTVAQWRQNEADSQQQTIDSQMRADTQNPNGR